MKASSFPFLKAFHTSMSFRGSRMSGSLKNGCGRFDMVELSWIILGIADIIIINFPYIYKRFNEIADLLGKGVGSLELFNRWFVGSWDRPIVELLNRVTVELSSRTRFGGDECRLH